MNLPPHVVQLYRRTVRKYNKLVSRLHRESTTAYQRKTFLHKLRKLLRKLRALESQLKMAAATGTLVMVLQSTPAKAQDTQPFSTLGPFVKQERINNPLREPIFNGEWPAMTAVDFDNDGDYDIVMGERYYDYYYYEYGGRLRYFENVTVGDQRLFVERLGEENPFDGIRALTVGTAPAFADIDGDGDLDLFLGNMGWAMYYPYQGNRIEYYRNDDGVFTPQTGSWNAQTKEGNPVDEVDLGYFVRPVFVDFDHDSDMDLVVGSNFDDYDGNVKYLQYYENDGNGNFTPVDWTLDVAPVYATFDSVIPAVVDIDGDGDYDLVLGNYYDLIVRYYEQVSPGNFEIREGEWNPDTKTGNPFESLKDLGGRQSIVFFDFNNDGLLDMFLADEEGQYELKYSDHIVNYYENQGDFVFKEKGDLENPFGGVFVSEDAAPVLVDLDGDGDLDVVVGNKYYRYNYYNDYDRVRPFYYGSTLSFFRNDDGRLTSVYGKESPFFGIEKEGPLSPDFADLDGDGDLDLIIAEGTGNVVYFRNEDGVFVEAANDDPFQHISHPAYASARLLDTDGDELLDLVIANDLGEIQVYPNTGSREAPAFPASPAIVTPLDTIRWHTWNTPHMQFVDVDHDGDRDIVFNGSWPDVETRAFVVGENIGSEDNPVYRNFVDSLFPELGTRERSDVNAFMADFDGDGDLDAFMGKPDGTVLYFENMNVPVTASLPDNPPLDYADGEAPVPILTELTLSDEDDDLIVQATVTIDPYQPGEVLSFTPQAGISGSFDVETGVLTLRGKATLAEYQTLLQSVTFESAYSEVGRQKPARPKNTILAKNISVAVYDQDFTTPATAVVSVDVFVNDPPSMEVQNISIIAGGSATLDLKTVITDPNGVGDLDLSSMQVVNTPGSGASVEIDQNGMLTIDYASLTFTGSESLTISACDMHGACLEGTINVTVTNTAPVVTPEPVSVSDNTAVVNLMDITTDAESNLDYESFSIVSQPLSGAVASIAVVSPEEVNLILDYEGVSFQGTDQLTIRACDALGACSDRVLEIEVDLATSGEITVYNAVAPNSSGDNRFMRILGLPEVHRVRIFSRWGDKVFESTRYDNSGTGEAFRGLNDDGKALASGTYFYIIEIPGEKDITGYLTLKQ